MLNLKRVVGKQVFYYHDYVGYIRKISQSNILCSVCMNEMS